MTTDRLRRAIEQDAELDKAAEFLAGRFGEADLNQLVDAISKGDVERISTVLGTEPDTLVQVFASLRKQARDYEAEFPEFREYQRSRSQTRNS